MGSGVMGLEQSVKGPFGHSLLPCWQAHSQKYSFFPPVLQNILRSNQGSGKGGGWTGWICVGGSWWSSGDQQGG